MGKPILWFLLLNTGRQTLLQPHSRGSQKFPRGRNFFITEKVVNKEKKICTTLKRAFYFKSLKRSLIFDCFNFGHEQQQNAPLALCEELQGHIAVIDTKETTQDVSKKFMACDAVTGVGTAGTPCVASLSSDESAVALAMRAFLRHDHVCINVIAHGNALEYNVGILESCPRYGS